MLSAKTFSIYTFIRWSIGAMLLFIVLTILIEGLWSYHAMAGYVLIGLYLLRIVVTALKGRGYVSPFAKNANASARFKGWLYMLFYFALAVSLYTGYMLANGPENLQESMQWVHVKSLYYPVTFVIVHTVYSLVVDAGMLSKVNTWAARKPGY